jgi:hypothetical protein
VPSARKSALSLVSNTADVLVLGGGIAGLTVALEAARRGLSVIVLDTPRPGSASRAAAGMLAPSLEELPAAMLGAAIAARDRYPAYVTAPREQTGIEVPLDPRGAPPVAPDSLTWEQPPARARHEIDVFRVFFDEALASGGALVVIDRANGLIIGSSRFHGYDEAASQVEIGWTASVSFRDVVARMVAADIARLETGVAEDPRYL